MCGLLLESMKVFIVDNLVSKQGVELEGPCFVEGT